jgi:hypothetical protein
MGLNFMDINPIPHLTSPLKGEEQAISPVPRMLSTHLTSPLKGEEQDKLAHMDRRRYDAVFANGFFGCFMKKKRLKLRKYLPIICLTDKWY